MTIGIAIKPNLGDFIVTASDQRQSFQDVFQPVDAGPVKVAYIAQKWAFLFAGGQMGYARTIQQHAMSLLKNATNVTFDEVKNSVRMGYERTANEIAHHKYLARYGFADVADFRANSFAQLGSKVTENLYDKLEKYTLGIELLVFGFDEIGAARFMQVDDDSIVDQTVINAWAVGTGTYLALGSFNSHTIMDQTIETYVYRACEAKFSAEFADAVGKTTSVYIWYPHGSFSVINTHYIELLRHHWEQSRLYPIPDKARAIIEKALQRDVNYLARKQMRRAAMQVTTVSGAASGKTA